MPGHFRGERVALRLQRGFELLPIARIGEEKSLGKSPPYLQLAEIEKERGLGRERARVRARAKGRLVAPFGRGRGDGGERS